MKVQYCIFLIIACSLAMSCNIFDSSSDAPKKSEAMGIIFFDDMDRIDFPVDEAAIDSVKLDADILSVKVSYSGGCKEHVFRMYVWRRFLESNPPQAELFLSHDSRNDNCEAYLSQWIEFDLTELVKYARSQYGSPGSVKLRIFAPNARQPYYPIPELFF